MKIIWLAVPVLVMQLFRGHYPVSLFNIGFRCGFVPLRVISLRVLSVPEPPDRRYLSAPNRMGTWL